MRGIWPWLLVLGGVLTGLTFTLQVVRSADAGMRVQFLTEARLMQRSLDWTAVKALRGEASDAAREEYARLKRQLEALRSVSPQYRFVYLLGWHDAGEVRFLVDSEPADSSDF